MKKNIKWIVCIFSLITFILLAYLVKTNENIIIDKYFYELIMPIINNNLTSIVKVITFLGSAFTVILITIICLIVIKNKKIGLFMALDLIIITCFQYLLKYTFLRNRPVDINLIEETGYSFPSGHSLTAMAFYGFIIYIVNKYNLKHKKIYTLLLSILIIMIGFSRIYLGVHYPTDVFGGLTFSLFYLIIFINVTKKYI